MAGGGAGGKHAVPVAGSARGAGSMLTRRRTGGHGRQG
ncbi:hypothetical protein PCLA_05r0648 [Pseudomonas citronellolis]|nr:hypothetical protein PCLA_05r0648 [Pseudomonas citronellolis]